MRFVSIGDETLPTIMMIPGMATTVHTCFDEIYPKLQGYHVILCELDGHYDGSSDFSSLKGCCEKIEEYVLQKLDGRLYGLLGFSLGGTISVELMSRGNIRIEKVILDAAFCVKMGILTPVYTNIFCLAIKRIKAGRKIPTAMLEAVMGKENSGIVDTFYKNVPIKMVRNECRDVYKYNLSPALSDFDGEVVFWHGSNENYPKKTAKLIKKYIPNMKTVVYEGMGHGQFMHEQPEAYAREIEVFMNCMDKKYAYFSHKECEYFPCHEGADEENFNCLFCYCPLYTLGEDCGGDFVYLENGIKDCTKCTYPHKRENYEGVTGRYGEIVERMKR